jgi:hypothetical protein
LPDFDIDCEKVFVVCAGGQTGAMGEHIIVIRLQWADGPLKGGVAVKTMKRLITTVSVGVIVSTFLIAPMASAQSAPVAGGECSPTDSTAKTPTLVCKETIVKGKKAFRWTKFKMKPAPNNLTGLRRCLWGEWMITGQAFTAYWDSVLNAFANVVKRDEPVEPGEVTDALADTGPVIFAGDIRFWFNDKTVFTAGSMSTEGMTVTNDAWIKYQPVGKAKITMNVPGSGGLFVVRIDGVEPIPMTPGEFEPVTVDVACTAKTLTWTIPLEGTSPVQIVLVRPTD